MTEYDLGMAKASVTPGKLEMAGVEVIDTQRAAEEDLHKHEADVLGRFNRALGYRADE
jgi:hypothetical protein